MGEKVRMVRGSAEVGSYFILWTIIGNSNRARSMWWFGSGVGSWSCVACLALWSASALPMALRLRAPVWDGTCRMEDVEPTVSLKLRICRIEKR